MSSSAVERLKQPARGSAGLLPHGAAALILRLLMLASIVVALARTPVAADENAVSELVVRQAVSEDGNCAGSTKAKTPERFEALQPAAPVDAASYLDHRLRTALRQIVFQAPPGDAVQTQTQRADLEKNPCAAMDEKPLVALGIGIALPAGKLPGDPATACWNQLNASAGPFAAIRFWPMTVYNWNATCLCHRPLYFEQINLERHGYGCCEPLQPLASAAHFFGTLPALPYCMAVECPCECVYTLGHYRPGSCPPLRYHWPPFSPLAAAAEGGVWTGMVFLIP